MSGPNTAPTTNRLPQEKTVVMPPVKPAAKEAAKNAQKKTGKTDGEWKELLSKTPQQIVNSLEKQDLTPKNANKRMAELVAALAKKIPFFDKMQESAKAKGYTYHLLTEDAPKDVLNHFKNQEILAVTHKLENKVFFNMKTITAMADKHADKMSFGQSFLENVANEGVHIIADSIKTDKDIEETVALLGGVGQLVAIAEVATEPKEPTKLEKIFRDTAEENLTSTIVGNLLGFAKDGEIDVALKPQTFPNNSVTDSHFLRRMLQEMDMQMPRFFSGLKNLDAASQRKVMGRQVSYVMGGELEQAVAKRLVEYGVLPKGYKMEALDKARLLQEIQKEAQRGKK